MLVLVTGATGYIGGRLVPQLLDAGHHVRCLTRRPEKLAGVPWADAVEIVAGDALDPERTARRDGRRRRRLLPRALDRHRRRASPSPTAAPRRTSPSRAAEPGVQRIVYLGWARAAR